MRVNLDDPDNDPRVRFLARLLDLPVLHAVGVLFGVWRTAYNRRSHLLTEQEIDLGGETVGLTKHMLQANLASPAKQDEGAASSTPQAPASLFRVHGVEARIEFLHVAAEKGRLGGIRSGEARRKLAEQYKSKRTPSRPQANPKPHEPSGSGSGSGSLDPPTPLKGGPGNARSRASGAGPGSTPNGNGSGRVGSYPDPRTIGGLADIEADYEARGEPIPWRDDPRRWGMTHDNLDRPVKPLGPRNGHHGGAR